MKIAIKNHFIKFISNMWGIKIVENWNLKIYLQVVAGIHVAIV